MKYILCQPAILRFKWELEVCITRLQKLGVQDIILLFTQGDPSIPDYFSEMGAEVHVYNDSDRDKSYIPAIKPYLWMRFLKEDTSREKESYFYMDSDVLIRDLPNVIPTESVWYASDCTSYIGNEYIDSKGDSLLKDMCNVIGVNHELIREKSPVGGAQWIIKNPSHEYWQKVYRDSIKLYRYLSNVESRYIRDHASDYVLIQKWTAEMWAQLWNVYHFGKDVEITSELDFSWPNNPREAYYHRKIFHNAGVTAKDKDLFFKGQYVDTSPFDDDLSFVNPDKASYEYVLAIKEVMNMAKYEVLEDFRDLEEDKEYFKGDRFPKPANKKIKQERLDELASSDNKAGRPLIKKVDDE